MKYILPIILSAFLLTGCIGPSTAWKTIRYENSCYTNAKGYQAAYATAHALRPYYWTKVIIIVGVQNYTNNKVTNHAVCVVEWNNRLYAYDNQLGTWVVTADLTLKDKPLELARKIAGSRYTFKSAHFEY